MDEKKKSKVLYLIIAIMALAIIGLIVYICASKGGKKDTSKETKTESTTAVVTTQALTEATSTEASKASESSATKKSGRPTTQAYAKISDGGGWKTGDKFVHQYNVDIHNDSKEDLSNWEVQLTGFEKGKVGDHWNAEFKLDGSVLKATSVDYNKTLAKNSTTGFGFQVEFDSESDEKATKDAVLFIDGKEYDVKREEPTTQSAEEKEKSQKEKKEPETGSPLSNHGALSVKGTDLVDKDGKPYQLKGISTHGLQWFPEYVNKDAFATFQSWGANVVRLAMYTDEGGYCTGANQEDMKKLVSDGVDYATELGMYVIIDWHILHDLTPLTYEDDATVFFDEMSAKYSKYDNVLYEICNEPNGGTTWADVKAYAEKVIPVIRKNDPDAVIIVGTPTWSQDVDEAAKDPLSFDNVMYTCHFYAATHKDNIRDKVKTAHDKGLAIFISEFSICDASGNGGIDYDSADQWMQLVKDYNLSYCQWNLSNKNESSSVLVDGCSKTSGWTDDDLSETGIWMKEQWSK